MKRVMAPISSTKKKLQSLDFDAHWYRRVFHAFGSSFVVYYMLPDTIEWIAFLKMWVPISVLTLAFFLEIARVQGVISGSHFFGLRMYEQKRVGSYLFFASGIVILLYFFPQQIAVPCILCACLADPIMGEARYRFGKKEAYAIGFLVCLLFFVVTWYKADLWVMMVAAFIGSIGAVLGESVNAWWLDDDFMIQLTPALLLLMFLIGVEAMGVTALPEPVIYPSLLPW
ncbi:MAG: dolichol kinase [Candidatus Thermoplasmatota archaeon]|nr:dolichol kinase [Candidatus Thermoplasmatota archaeon]